MADGAVAILGGTGKLGTGLALRWALAGRRVLIGSRRAGAAQAAAARLAAEHPGTAMSVAGASNADAAASCSIAVVAVPFWAQAATLRPLGAALSGRVVVSAAVPLRFDAELGAVAVEVPEGSAAEQAAALLEGARVVGGLHTVSSVTLQRAPRPVDGDVLLTADDPAALATVADLVRAIPHLRPVDAGPLAVSRHIEALATVLIGINRRVRRHTGIAITDLPDERAT